MQFPTAWVLQAELHRSSGAKKRRHQDDKAGWYTAGSHPSKTAKGGICIRNASYGPDSLV